VWLVDFAIIRDGVKQILADTSDRLVAGQAADGAEALRLLAQWARHLLVLDISMLGTGRIELIKRIRRDDPLLPILVFSKHAPGRTLRAARPECRRFRISHQGMR
jgi:DNA-binding NarL/FixJ family response regulator